MMNRRKTVRNYVECSQKTCWVATVIFATILCVCITLILQAHIFTTEYLQEDNEKGCAHYNHLDQWMPSSPGALTCKLCYEYCSATSECHYYTWNGFPTAHTSWTVFSCSASDSEACQDSPANWIDLLGATCLDYKKQLLCTGQEGPRSNWDAGRKERFQHWADSNGIDASQACCICGGGSKLPGKKQIAEEWTNIEEPSATLPGTTASSCTDDEEWVDIVGNKCSAYKAARCATASVFADKAGVDARQACCICKSLAKPAAKGTAASSCTDDEYWADSVGYDCSDYQAAQCASASLFANKEGVSAKQACCVCKSKKQIAAKGKTKDGIASQFSIPEEDTIEVSGTHVVILTKISLEQIIERLIVVTLLKNDVKIDATDVSVYSHQHEKDTGIQVVSKKPFNEVLVINRQDCCQEDVVGGSIMATMDGGIHWVLNEKFKRAESMYYFTFKIPNAELETNLDELLVRLQREHAEQEEQLEIMGANVIVLSKVSADLVIDHTIQVLLFKNETKIPSLELEILSHPHLNNEVKIVSKKPFDKVLVINRQDCCQADIVGGSIMASFDGGATWIFRKTFRRAESMYLFSTNLFYVTLSRITLAQVQNQTFDVLVFNRGTKMHHKSVRATAGNGGNGVTLTSKYVFDEVFVVNRQDCCQQDIVGGSIRATIDGGERWIIDATFKNAQPIYFFTRRKSFVTITSTEVINLAEVVLSNRGRQIPMTRLRCLVNGFLADDCIDGNRETICHSVSDGLHWLVVFSSGAFDQVKVINREDCCADRIVGAKIKATNDGGITWDLDSSFGREREQYNFLFRRYVEAEMIGEQQVSREHLATALTCADDEEWIDAVGYDCSAYTVVECPGASVFANAEGVDARQACCVCKSQEKTTAKEVDDTFEFHAIQVKDDKKTLNGVAAEVDDTFDFNAIQVKDDKQTLNRVATEVDDTFEFNAIHVKDDKQTLNRVATEVDDTFEFNAIQVKDDKKPLNGMATGKYSLTITKVSFKQIKDRVINVMLFHQGTKIELETQVQSKASGVKIHSNKPFDEVIVINRKDCCQTLLVGGTIQATADGGRSWFLDSTFRETEAVYIFSPRKIFLTIESILNPYKGEDNVLNLGDVGLYLKGVEIPKKSVQCIVSGEIQPACHDGKSFTILHSNQSPWLVIFSDEPFNEVEVINRPDCCKDRIVGASIKATFDGGVTWSINSKFEDEREKYIFSTDNAQQRQRVVKSTR